MKIIYSKLLTKPYHGRFCIWFIALRDMNVSHGLVRHEFRHADQYKKDKFRFISQLWDMEVRTDLEIDAYLYDGRYTLEKIAFIIHKMYNLSILGRFLGTILGKRTHKYSEKEILDLINARI